MEISNIAKTCLNVKKKVLIEFLKVTVHTHQLCKFDSINIPAFEFKICFSEVCTNIGSLARLFTEGKYKKGSQKSFH